MKKTYLLGTLALAAVVALPSVSYAALYAYVNQDGEVRTVEASSPGTAIQTAPAIAEHSGVILINSTNDATLVGDDVSGV